MKLTDITNPRRMKGAAYVLVAPLLALAFSFLISTLVLALSGNSAIDAYRLMWDFGTRLESIVSTINRAIPYYVAGVAVAIGFKMNLFNIGVEGQFRISFLIAAWAGAELALPGPINIVFLMAVAMTVGGLWAGGIGLLKVTRGVNEVVSSIMLNFTAYALISYLLLTYLQYDDPDSLVTQTRTLPQDSRIPNLDWLVNAIPGVRELRPRDHLSGFLVGAIVIGVLYYLVVWRTRFGYDLRATGANPWAARASGVDPRRMIVTTMVLSGAVAGLIGMTELLSQRYRFDTDIATGVGFTGIGVALLGRNNPIGIAAGAFLFGFLERSAQILDLEGIPKEIVQIMQGVILISVVIAYEVVDRFRRAQEAREIARIEPEALAPAAATGARA
ncbi:MAG: ABC transporter permease [Acidimicrobiia bacterium]|nr:MAG: ABC transporter permease [Acidimicrobiia bacterium]